VFDIAFSEIVVIAVVALVVIGPERLPKVAKTLGHMFGRLQRYVNDVKADISREMELDELRKLQSEVQSAGRDLESSVSGAAREMESGVRSVETQLNEAGNASSEAGNTSASASAPASSVVEAAEAAAAASADSLPIPTDSSDVAVKAPPDPVAAGESPRQGALPGFDRI
jgi:sec-independent protein translocase protein TatB